MPGITSSLIQEMNAPLAQADINELINALERFLDYRVTRRPMTSDLGQYMNNCYSIHQLTKAILVVLEEIPADDQNTDINILLSVLKGETGRPINNILDALNTYTRATYQGSSTVRELTLLCLLVVTEKR